MAYKQNNPLSRKSSSPLFRKRGISPLNSRRLDPDAKKIAYPETGLSRRSSSPLSGYPTSGSFEATLEEAERKHAPGENEEYVNIGTEEAPVWDLQTRIGNVHYGSSVSDYGTDDQEVNFASYKPRPTDSNPDRVSHPLGLAEHDYSKQVVPVKGKIPNPSMYPVRAASTWGGPSTDVLYNVDEYGMLDERLKPSVNPFKVGSYGGGTHGGGENWLDSGLFTSNYYKGDRVTDDYLNTPWEYASQRFGDGSGPRLPQEGLTTVGYSGSPAIYPFFSNLSQNRAGNVTEDARSEGGLLTKNFGELPRGITNRVNVTDAFSTYVNRNTMNPEELYDWDRSAPRPGTSLRFSDEFRTQFPQMLAGGTGIGGMDTYDLDTNMFKNALSSSRFRGNTSGETTSMGDTRSNAYVDNPVDIMTKMVNDGQMTQEQAKEYLARLRQNTYSGQL